MTQPDASGLFETVRRQLAESSAARAEQQRVEHTAEAADGAIRITVAQGLVSDVVIEARALRLGNAELADAVKEAVNQVLEQANEAGGALEQRQVGEWTGSIADLQSQAEALMTSTQAQITHSIDTIRAISAQHQGRNFTPD